MPLARLEPAIFGSEVQRHTHEATGPSACQQMYMYCRVHVNRCTHRFLYKDIYIYIHISTAHADAYMYQTWASM